MIHNFKKRAENGRKLADTHSPSYGLSSDALYELIQENDLIRENNGNVWKLALDCIDIGTSIGYAMAENDIKNGKIQESSPKVPQNKE